MPIEKCEFCLGNGEVSAKTLAYCSGCVDGAAKNPYGGLYRCGTCKGTSKVVVTCSIPCKYCEGFGSILVAVL